MPNSLDTELCFITNFNNVEEALNVGLSISKTKLKKKYFSKKFLSATVGKKSFKIPLDLVNQGFINPDYSGPDIEILLEDERVLVLNKPTNIHCHPLTYTEKDNCLSYLRKNLFFRKSEFCHERNLDPGLLYRLDLGTSGVLFLVKRKNDYEKIRKNFSEMAKIKTYLAIVEGELKEEGEFEHYFKASHEKGKKMSVFKSRFEGEDLLQGKIRIKKISYNKDKNLTLLSIELGKGIRHQIRAQLAHLGHPVLGDVLYGGKEGERLFLHAYHYKIEFPDKEYEVIAKNAPLFERFFDLDGIF